MPKVKAAKQVKQRCANIKNRNNPQLRCIYPCKKGDFCSRHWKHPNRFTGLPLTPATSTRSVNIAAKKIQKWWRFRYGITLAKERTAAYFCREICHNDRDLATLEPLSNIPRDYFFIIKEKGKFWGFDIRTLLIQYETNGKLENIYTTESCEPKTLEAFRRRIDLLRRWKKTLQFEEAIGLSVKQSWSLRVLDVCLRLDMLGYRIATQWFSDLNIIEQRKLYTALYFLWNEGLNLTEEQKQRIVPEYALTSNRLFRWTADKITVKHDLDSIRRTNLHIVERLISSATMQSDKTLGAMYTIIGLCQVSQRCSAMYPWLV
jgi:hypothetical protein